MTGRLRTIRARIVLLVVLVTVLGLGSVVGYATFASQQASIEDGRRYGVQTAEAVASDVERAMNEPVQTARDLAATFAAQASVGGADRDSSDRMLLAVLAGHKGFLGTWTVWEPNAFDGKDAQHRKDPRSDASGRYIPYAVIGSDGKASVTPLVDYEKEGVGDYFLLPKKTGKEVVLDPYTYAIDGVDVLMTSVCVPVTVNGTFAGVAGVDTSLDSLQAELSTIAPLGTGRVELVTASGTVIAGPKGTTAGKPAEPSLVKAAAAVSASGKTVQTTGATRLVSGDALVVEVSNPVRIKLADEKEWTRQGRMNFVDNQLNPRSGTLRGRAIIDNKDQLLQPGLFARLQLFGGESDALLIPDAAVVSDQTRKIAFVVGADNVVKAAPLDLGPIYEGLRVVRGGLKPDDRIVIDGIANPAVRPGAKVTAQPGTIKAVASN